MGYQPPAEMRERVPLGPTTEWLKIFASLVSSKQPKNASVRENNVLQAVRLGSLMTRKEFAREAVIVAGTGALSGALFWMAVFLAGPIVVLPGAGVLLVALIWFARKMKTAQLVAERTAMACLFAAQASLFVAVVMEVLPEFVRGIF